ncbi:hypothetical protein AAFM71_07695 [Chromobacterium violaceum]|uniref:hypothetical protein n=1 Tax=Chromobacterium violaceum TaxID=536 RepID=UPI00385BD4FF
MNWGELYAHLIACTGLPPDTITQQFDLPRLEAMNTYWRNHPPLHLMVAAYLGIKPETPATPTDDQPDLATVLAQFPQAGM